MSTHKKIQLVQEPLTNRSTKESSGILPCANSLHDNGMVPEWTTNPKRIYSPTIFTDCKNQIYYHPEYDYKIIKMTQLEGTLSHRLKQVALPYKSFIIQMYDWLMARIEAKKKEKALLAQKKKEEKKRLERELKYVKPKAAQLNNPNYIDGLVSYLLETSFGGNTRIYDYVDNNIIKTKKLYCKTEYKLRELSIDYCELKVNSTFEDFREHNPLYVNYHQALSCWLRNLCAEGIEPNPGPRNKQIKSKKNKKRPNNRRVVRTERSALIMPPRHVASLLYVDSAYVRNNPGNNYLVYSFRINDLYDPDPLILSGSISGFKELMQFYQYYRVLKFGANINLSNNEAFDLMYGAVFSQSNLTGVISSRDDAINALENNYCKGPFLLSEKTGIDRGTMKLSIRPSSLLGVPRQYFSDNNYIGIGLATPTIPLWLNFIVCSPTGSPLTNGYTTTTKLFFVAEFFGRLNLRA